MVLLLGKHAQFITNLQIKMKIDSMLISIDGGSFPAKLWCLLTIYG